MQQNSAAKQARQLSKISLIGEYCKLTGVLDVIGSDLVEKKGDNTWTPVTDGLTFLTFVAMFNSIYFIKQSWKFNPLTKTIVLYLLIRQRRKPV